MFGRKTRTHNHERGQSLVELTLGMAVLVMLISGLVDLGRAYFVYVALEDGAGEAALYLSITPDCWHSSNVPFDGIGNCADPNNAINRATNAGGGSNSLVNWENIPEGYIVATWEDNDSANTATYQGTDTVPSVNALPSTYKSQVGPGDTVTVSIRYDFQLLTPFIPKITGVNPLPLRAEASQWIVDDPNP